MCLFSPAAGSLPSEWSALAAAQSIDVSGNSLTGALPASWSSLSQLQVPRSAKQSGRGFLMLHGNRQHAIPPKQADSVTWGAGHVPAVRSANTASYLYLKLLAALREKLPGGTDAAHACCMQTPKSRSVYRTSIRPWIHRLSFCTQTLNIGGNAFSGGIPAAWRRRSASGAVTGMTSLTSL